MSEESGLFNDINTQHTPTADNNNEEPAGGINVSETQAQNEIDKVLHGTTEQEQEQEQWCWAEGVKGTGEIPPFFKKEKYKYVIDQVNAYPALEKKLGSTTESASENVPEKYDFALGDGFEDLQLDPTTDSRLEQFSQLGKKNGFSQETFTSLLQNYFTWQEKDINAQDELVKKQLEQFKNDELNKIDPDPTVRTNKIQELQNYYKTRFPGIDVAQIRASIQTANDFNMFETMMKQLQKMQLPSSTRLTAAPTLSADQLREMQKNPLYGRDTAYTTRVDEAYKRLYAS